MQYRKMATALSEGNTHNNTRSTHSRCNTGVWGEPAHDEDVRLRLRRLPMILKTRPDHMNTMCV